MQRCHVTGSTVATQKAAGLTGFSLLTVTPVGGGGAGGAGAAEADGGGHEAAGGGGVGAGDAGASQPGAADQQDGRREPAAAGRDDVPDRGDPGGLHRHGGQPGRETSTGEADLR